MVQYDMEEQSKGYVSNQRFQLASWRLQKRNEARSMYSVSDGILVIVATQTITDKAQKSGQQVMSEPMSGQGHCYYRHELPWNTNMCRKGGEGRNDILQCFYKRIQPDIMFLITAEGFIRTRYVHTQQ